MLETVEVDPRYPAAGVVIWLHGLGADGHDFEPVVDELALPLPVRFVFPHAPIRPVTINAGMRMRAWYDLLTLSGNGPEDESGIRASAAEVRALVGREQARGFRSRQIVLAGFSQGGAVALHAALREADPLAGVLALSTYLPLPTALPQERSAANAEIPIWMAHGTQDPVIPMSLAAASCKVLRGHGYAVSWHTYPMGHSVCAAQVRDIREWLARRWQ